MRLPTWKITIMRLPTWKTLILSRVSKSRNELAMKQPEFQKISKIFFCSVRGVGKQVT